MDGRDTALISEQMLMILPAPRLIMAGTTALLTENTDFTLVAKIWSNLSSGKSSSGARNCVPALLTRMSIGPISASANSTASPMLSALVTSKASARTRTPDCASFSDAAPSAAVSRPLRMTSAPAPASAAAMA